MKDQTRIQGQDNAGRFRAAVYVRMSRDREGLALGVGRQEADCRALADRLGWDVVEVLSDNDISVTRSRRRPAWERLLAGLESGEYEAVLAYSSSRMYRRLKDLLPLVDLVKTNPRIRIATIASNHIDLTTADGRMLAGILAAVDQAEAERIGERGRRQKLAAREAGKPNGGGRRPYGYRYQNGAYVVVPEEAKVLRQVANRIIRGEPLYRVVIDLNARGIKTGGHSTWRPGTLRHILVGGFHAGMSKDGIRGQWPAVLRPEQLQLLRARLPGRTPKVEGKRERPGARRYVFSGVATCALCGHVLNGSGGLYKCAIGAGGCGKVTINAQALEATVWKTVPFTAEPAAQDQGAGEQAILQEIMTLEVRLDSLAEGFANGSRFAQVAATKIEAQIEELRDRLARVALPTTMRPGQATAELVRAWQLGDLDPAGVDALRSFYVEALDELVIGPGTRGHFDPHRIKVTPSMKYRGWAKEANAVLEAARARRQ